MNGIKPQIRSVNRLASECGLAIPVEISYQGAWRIEDDALESILQIDSHMNGLYEPEDSLLAHTELAKAVRQLVVSRQIRQILGPEIAEIAEIAA